MILETLVCVVIQVLSTGAGPTQLPEVESTTNSNFCPCPKNETAQSLPALTSSMELPSTVNMELMHTTLVHGMPCVCNIGFRSAPGRDDYYYTPGVGAHKLHTRAVSWNDARKMCNDEGGNLAIVNSLIEAHVCNFIYFSIILISLARYRLYTNKLNAMILYKIKLYAY